MAFRLKKPITSPRAIRREQDRKTQADIVEHTDDIVDVEKENQTASKKLKS